MVRFILFFFLAAFSLSPVSAQSPSVLKRDGEKAFSDGRWTDAHKLLSAYQSAQPGDVGILTKLGIASYHLGLGAEARRYLEYVVTVAAGGKDPESQYYLSRVYHGLSDWERAIASYKSFLKIAGEKHPLRENTADNILRCVAGSVLQPNADIALMENMGSLVNSPGDEFAPLPSLNHADLLYFAAARKGCNGDLRNEEGFEDLNRGRYCSDMFRARLENSGWETAGSIGGLLNTARFEIPLGFNANGQVLYFFRGFTTYSGQFFADTASRKDEYALNPPPFVSSVRPEEGDTDPFFFNDRTVVFASRRKGGQGGLDLWITTFQDSLWSEPVNLGSRINSPYDETTPFLARDGRTLWFSSNRTGSMGGLDIFSAVFDEKKLTWGDPVNAGTPVNSPADDAGFKLSADGSTAFLASDRFGGYGERDLYIVYFREPRTASMTASAPGLFYEVKGSAIPDLPVENVMLAPLFYESDTDLMNEENRGVLEKAIKAALVHPEVQLLVTVFNDAAAQSRFDLYSGIKRAETVGKALVEAGVPAVRVHLRCVGASYPLARPILDDAVNPAAARLNRRVEITLVSAEPLTFPFQLLRPQLPDPAPGIGRLDEQSKGLVFRVEAATTRQILTNDAIAMFSDVIIETQPKAGTYRYMAGCVTKFAEALALKKELAAAGFPDTKISAYVNNRPITKAEAVSLMKKYPELLGYVKLP
ncbi:MAG: hypothetical protein RL013_467 [Bacteroidota bacterium]|jgi:tetratricopeptide (TPR) repeat protein